jgi:PadR family transcriptional regulator AphA
MSEERTSTVESLLGVLSLGPMSGYQMRQFMDQSTGNFWRESFGQIYPALKAMLKDGLIATVDEHGEGRPGKKVYRITEAGETRLRQWLGAPAKQQVWRNELLLKVFYGNRAEKGAIAGHVAEARHGYAVDVARYEEILGRLQMDWATHPGMPYWCMTVRYGIAESKALMAWCDETLAELQGIEDRG